MDTLTKNNISKISTTIGAAKFHLQVKSTIKGTLALKITKRIWNNKTQVDHLKNNSKRLFLFKKDGLTSHKYLCF